jgi:hypothetical protein
MQKRLKRMLSFIVVQLMIAAVIYGSGNSSAAVNSHPVYKQLRNIKLSGEAVQVRDLVLKRDAAVFNFKKGTFYFLEAVENQCTGAVFIGDGTFTMTPVLAEERHHLMHLTGGPSISETFSRMILRFTDETYKEITASGGVQQVSSVSTAEGYLKRNRKLLRRGKRYSRPNIAVSLLKYNLDLRLLTDITWPGQGGFFHSFFDGDKYGDILFIIDPLGVPPVAPEEVVMACLGEKNLGIWVAEHRQEVYTQDPAAHIDHRLIDMEHYDIEAATRGNHLEAAVTARFNALVDGARVIPFYLFPGLRMGAVTDEESGHLPFIQEQDKEDADFAIILPHGLKKGKQYTITFEYRGKDALVDEGGGNFSLVARSGWYPNPGFTDRAAYRITLKTPAELSVVASGRPVDREVRGSTLISRWESDLPLIGVGFNYGKFKKSEVKDEKTNVTIESYANIDLPNGFRMLEMMVSAYELETRQHLPLNPGSLDPVQLMDKVRAEAQVGVRIYRQMFGPMPFNRVAITQQPFPNFGEAWPMLVYMPIIAYFSDSQLEQMGLFPVISFVRYACAHEVAHQWWGNTVGCKSYRSRWLSEAFAQLSTSLFAQVVYKKAKFLEFWKDLRKQALKKNRKRKCPSKIGSITLGYRLDTGRTGNVTHAAFYAKGAFIAHMLRMLMWEPRTGDQRFSNMLKDFVKTYYNRDASTEDFKRIVEKHITREMDLEGNGKMDWFFNQWLHGTKIPHYTLDYRVEPAGNGEFTLSCTVTQSKVDDSFRMRVPIYAVFDDNKTFRIGSVVLKGNSTSPAFVVKKLPREPKRVLLCANEDVLCTIKGR